MKGRHYRQREEVCRDLAFSSLWDSRVFHIAGIGLGLAQEGNTGLLLIHSVSKS